MEELVVSEKRYKNKKLYHEVAGWGTGVEGGEGCQQLVNLVKRD